MTLGRNTRHVKGKAESVSDAVSSSKQTEFVSGQMHRVDVQKTAEQQELMKVVDSPPEKSLHHIAWADGDRRRRKCKDNFFWRARRVKLRHHSVQASWKSQSRWKPTKRKVEIYLEKPETEEMETNQASVCDAFSFAWPNVMEPFLVQTVQPAEELMGTDQEAVTASPCVAQLEEITETMQEQFQTSMPFRQVGMDILTCRQLEVLEHQRQALQHASRKKRWRPTSCVMHVSLWRLSYNL